MGLNVFLGLRYVIWGREGDPDFTEIARRANILLTQGIGRWLASLEPPGGGAVGFPKEKST